ncbi:MAG: type II secretion system F family protein [Pirellulales bacterium]
MSFIDSKRKRPIALDDLIALNDEIAALVRAGVPLERGLVEAGPDLPGRLRRMTNELGRRLAQGETLAEALAGQRGRFPPLYAAVVEAGLRSGRLPAALESVAASARRIGELRRVSAAALVYPLIVVSLAYGLSLAFIIEFAPRMAGLFESFAAPSAPWMHYLARAGASAAWWGPALPALVLGALLAWWLGSGRSLLVQPHWARRTLGWIPGVGGLLSDSQTAMFTELAALLVEHETPLGEALVLAADATGSSSVQAEAQKMAGAIERGDSLDACWAGSPSLPPLACWLIARGHQSGTLCAALHHTAEIYRERARERAEATQLLLPVILTVGIAGSATLAYALLVFLPWTSLLRSITG